MTDGLHFERVAPVFDRGRPGYPRELYTALKTHGVLAPGARLLEIGAGSGQATADLVAEGAVIDAIEPGPQLASLLERRLPEVRLFRGTFDQVDLPQGEYDAVVGATSFQWLDLPAALPAIHASLRPGGRLAVWWTVFGDPDVRTPFRDRVAEIAGGGRGRGVPGPLAADARIADLTQGGWFTAPRHEVFRWTIDLNREQVFDLFSTFPGWAAAPDRIKEAAEAVDEVGRPGPIGPLVTEHYVTALYVLERAADEA